MPASIIRREIATCSIGIPPSASANAPGSAKDRVEIHRLSACLSALEENWREQAKSSCDKSDDSVTGINILTTILHCTTMPLSDSWMKAEKKNSDARA
jgi:hypothetical protein